MRKQIYIPSVIGYSPKVYKFASAPFIITVLYTDTRVLSIEQDELRKSRFYVHVTKPWPEDISCLLPGSNDVIACCDPEKSFASEQLSKLIISLLLFFFGLLLELCPQGFLFFLKLFLFLLVLWFIIWKNISSFILFLF